MLFICYFEIMPEKIKEVTKGTIRHSEHAGEGTGAVKVIFEGQAASHWGIAAFEADSSEAVFRYIRPWCPVNGKILVEPALRVDDGEFAQKFPREILEEQA